MFKKIAFTFSIKIIIAILNLAIVIMLSRYIGAAGKGEASLIVTSVAMILLFCNMVGGSSLVYFVPRYNILQLFILSNVWSVIVCGFAYLLLLNVPLIGSYAILHVVLLSLINSLLATNLTILLGKEKITAHNWISLFQALVNILILWFMFTGMTQPSVQSYIYSLYASMGFCLLVSSILVLPIIRNDNTAKDAGLPKQLVKYGVYNQIGHVMKFMSFRCTYYMLSNYSGDIILGIFSNGISLIESVFLISNSIATVLYPKVSNSTDTVYAQKLSLQLTKFSIILCILALVPMMLLPSTFFVWLFGSEFANVHDVIILLAPGILFYNIALVLGHYFSGIGKYQVNTFANLIGLITTLLLAFVYYPHFGIWEVGIISTISYLTTAAWVMIYFAKDSSIRIHELLPRMADIKWLKNETLSLFKRTS